MSGSGTGEEDNRAGFVSSSWVNRLEVDRDLVLVVRIATGFSSSPVSPITWLPPRSRRVRSPRGLSVPNVIVGVNGECTWFIIISDVRILGVDASVFVFVYMFGIVLRR